jgi:hypothetical protein
MTFAGKTNRDYTTTTGPNDTLLLELMCPSGAIQLGTGWINEQQRSAEIRAFLSRPKRQHVI